MSKLDNLMTICSDCEHATTLDAEAKQAMKDLMLETYQAVRDRTRNEHELDDLFEKAVKEL